ncbi:MAG: riboflavin synthase [Chloroflexi bacterium]|nr:riboflavin synthase [Chloroflexota bacterium]MBF16321.1 riboflavin synthase [Chloroflexota bacterium]|tara:strand:- start:257 stop:844 length:588 start_codon:yes stop_codon:yes gene_type:complete
MFSGIIEEVGKVISYDKSTMVVEANKVLDDLKISESIMVAGACLTVTNRNTNNFTVETIPETFRRTNFMNIEKNSYVNLERALSYGQRVGGHMVQGHVDGTGIIISTKKENNSNIIKIKTDQSINQYLVEKGYIAIDGTSLTIIEVNSDFFSIGIIPFTYEHTTIKYRKEKDLVNLELDITAKYISKLCNNYIKS